MESLRPCFFFSNVAQLLYLESLSFGWRILPLVGPLWVPLVPFATHWGCFSATQRTKLFRVDGLDFATLGTCTHLVTGTQHMQKIRQFVVCFFWMVGFASFVGDHPPVFQNIVFLVDFLVDTCRVRLCKPPKIRGLTIANKRHTTVWKRWLVAVFHGRKNSITRQEALGTWRNKQCFVDFLGWAWPKKYPVNCLGYFRMVSGPLMSIHFETCWEMQSPHKWWGKASTNNYPPRNLT